MSENTVVYHYFGPWWDSLYEDIEYVAVPTPVGQPCSLCLEDVQDGDQGYMRPHGDYDESGALVWTLAPIHRECLLQNTSGHTYGYCHYTHPEMSYRQTALAAWATAESWRNNS